MKRINAKTQWLGLWDYGNGVYKGNTIRRHELPPHAKLIVKENEHYKVGSAQPKFVYCFASGSEENVENLNVEYVEYYGDVTVR